MNMDWSKIKKRLFREKRRGMRNQALIFQNSDAPCGASLLPELAPFPDGMVAEVSKGRSLHLSG
jgi:hypothetical protein